MANHRQENATSPVGIASSFDDFLLGGRTAASTVVGATTSRQGGVCRHSLSSSISGLPTIRGTLKLHRGGRRVPRSSRLRPIGTGLLVFFALCIVSITIIGGDFLVSFIHNHTGEDGAFWADNFLDHQDQSTFLAFWNRRQTNYSKRHTKEDDNGDIIYSSHEQAKKVLQFGSAFVSTEELLDRDSRYWDRDDRRRHGLDHMNGVGDIGAVNDVELGFNKNREQEREIQFEGDMEEQLGGNGGLYNEKGRKELRMYEEEFKTEGHIRGYEEGDEDYEYGGSGDEDEIENDSTQQSVDGKIFLQESEAHLYSSNSQKGNSGIVGRNNEITERMAAKVFVLGNKQGNANRKSYQRSSRMNEEQEMMNKRPKRRRHTAYPCVINFLDKMQNLSLPDLDPKFANFSLSYITEEVAGGVSGWKPRFAGHQTLQKRENSFVATNHAIHCGFVQELGSTSSTGFDLKEEDRHYLNTCKIAVSSCIFGGSDNIHSPKGLKLTGSVKMEVCFVIFVDQKSLDIIKQDHQEVDANGYYGLWRVVVVRHMPYEDMRRVGKIPKLLSHRLFPSARYSIWVDSKLRLQTDPILMLEYFLWRKGQEYAISNHYDRHCVWEEVLQNKKLNKYNHTAIDEQFEFYQADGLKRFNASNPKKLLPSNVPEGSFIIRAHTPMSNLFSCLWFNEVDRFTSRDQLSFAYTYMKLVKTNPDKHFYLNMFKDCERKTIAKLYRHRANKSGVI